MSQQLEDQDLQETIRRIVDQAPPLTEQQAARLALLLADGEDI